MARRAINRRRGGANALALTIDGGASWIAQPASVAPTDIIVTWRSGFASGIVPEDTLEPITVADLSVDQGSNVTFELTANPGDKFEIIGTELRLIAPLDQDVAASHVLQVTASNVIDSTAENVTVTVAGVDLATFDIRLTPLVNVGHLQQEIIDPDAAALFATWVDQGPAFVRQAVSTYIAGLKTDGLWTGTDGLFIPCLHTEQASLQDFKVLSRVAAPIGGIPFTPFKGFQGNGVDQLIDTTINPAALTNFLQNVGGMMSYALSGGQSSALGDVGTRRLRHQHRSTTNTAVISAHLVEVALANQFDGVGCLIQSRRTADGAGTVYTKRDGAAVQSNAGSSAAVQAHTIYLSGNNRSDADATIDYSTRVIGAFWIGGQLSDAQMLALRNRTKTLLEALGALQTGFGATIIVPLDVRVVHTVQSTFDPTPAIMFDGFVPQTTRYVALNGSDTTGTGSEAAPFRTIPRAFQNFPTSGGILVAVRGGVHAVAANINLGTASPSVSNPVIIRSIDGIHAAVLNGSTHTAGNAVMSFHRKHGIVVDGFKIIHNFRGLQFSGNNGDPATDIVFRNIWTHGRKSFTEREDGIKGSQGRRIQIIDCLTEDTGEEGIDFVAVNDFLVAYCHCRVNGIDHVHVNQSSALITIKGGSTNGIVQNCLGENNHPLSNTLGHGMICGGQSTNVAVTFQDGFGDGHNGTETYDARFLTWKFNHVRNVREFAFMFYGAKDCVAHDNLFDAANGASYAVYSIAGSPELPTRPPAIRNEAHHNIIPSPPVIMFGQQTGSSCNAHDNTTTGTFSHKVGPRTFTVQPFQVGDS